MKECETCKKLNEYKVGNWDQLAYVINRAHRKEMRLELVGWTITGPDNEPVTDEIILRLVEYEEE